MERSNRYVREYGLEVMLLALTIVFFVVMMGYQRPIQNVGPSSVKVIVPIKVPPSVEQGFRSFFAVE